jgi:hypothetical protein
MVLTLLVLAGLLSMLIWTGQHWQRLRTRPLIRTRAVVQQHWQLWLGSDFNQNQVDAFRSQFLRAFERDECEGLDKLFSPGIEFTYMVRALSEIRSPKSIALLERLSIRRITENSEEQTWYQCDVAQALRTLDSTKSLPLLLRRSNLPLTTQAGDIFAAQLIAFPNFLESLTDPMEPTRSQAFRVLLRALEGVCGGRVPLSLVCEARLAKQVRALIPFASKQSSPTVGRIFLQSLRFLRRFSHPSMASLLEGSLATTLNDECEQIANVESELREYLNDLPNELRKDWDEATVAERRDSLILWQELGEPVGAKEFLERLDDPREIHRPELLRWVARCGEEDAGHILLEHCRAAIDPRKSDERPEWCLELIRQLRWLPRPENQLLVAGILTQTNLAWQREAIATLAWEEDDLVPPLRERLEREVNADNSDLRDVARMTLARMGHRSSLQWLRNRLDPKDQSVAHQTLEAIADHGITLLWPEIDLLIEIAEPPLAMHAIDVVERFREAALGVLH